MKDQFRQFISKSSQLQEEEYLAFEGLMYEDVILKKEHLIKASEICNKIAFFSEGYFRFYHYGTDGTEVTSDFYFAPGFITSYTSLITGNPSKVYVQAMEDMKILVLRKSDLQNLYSKYHSIDRFGRLIAEQVAIDSEKHLFSLLNQTADERYKNLLDSYPQYIQKIPLQYIASYLGIKQETLSRVRKNIK